MKKFVTTILLSLLSVIIVFAFTACDLFQTDSGDKDNNKTEQDGEVKYTVTEEEWNEALSLFYSETIEENEDKLNFKVVREYIEEANSGDFYFKYTYIYEFDNINKMAHIQGIGEEEKFEKYYWESDKEEICYGWDNYELDFFDLKFTEVISEIIDRDLLFTYCISDFRDYNSFTFNKETNSYNGVVDYYGKDNAYLKFNNGNLTELYMESVFEEGTIKDKYSFEYGITVTIPDEILNLAN